MNAWLMRLYHRLPGPARSVAAGARGWYLRAWRYGPETDRLVAEAIERDRWSADQWRCWREERLAMVLERAARRVPYYRDQWAERRRRGDRAAWDVLANWPVLEKDTVRGAPEAFIADDCSLRTMFHDHTSGTTGKSLDVWLRQETVQQWYALCEARWRRWYGVDRHDRWAIFGGQLVVPVHRRTPPFWVWNPALHQLYCSAYHLAPDLIRHYVEALRRYRVRYVLGYPSALYALAQGILAEALSGPELRVAVVNAEPLYDYQRSTIEQAFGCPVRETYGMAEIVAAASECEGGHLHLWPEAGVLEVLEGGQPVAAGEAGSLVSTGLLNADMPLIRYAIGDRGALAADDAACTCGRTLPILAFVDGRSDDVLLTRDGRRIGRLDPVFKTGTPVVEAQVIQESLDRVRVRYVPTPDFTDASAREIVARIQDRMGRIAVEMEPVAAIPRSSNGKFRAVINRIPGDPTEPTRHS